MKLKAKWNYGDGLDCSLFFLLRSVWEKLVILLEGGSYIFTYKMDSMDGFVHKTGVLCFPLFFLVFRGMGVYKMDSSGWWIDDGWVCWWLLAWYGRTCLEGMKWALFGEKKERNKWGYLESAGRDKDGWAIGSLGGIRVVNLGGWLR